MQSLINDSEYLQKLFEEKLNDRNYDIEKNEIIEVTPYIKNHDLIINFYEGNINFNNNELIQLLEYLNYLKCSRVIDIFILMKCSQNPEYFNSKLNIYLIVDYNKIILHDNIFLTAVANNAFYLVKKIINSVNNETMQQGFDISIINDNVDIYSLFTQHIDEIIFNDDALIGKYGSMDILKYILSNPTEIQNYIFNKNTMFIFAARYGKYDAVKLLLENGANVNFRNGYALRFASRNGHYEIGELLKSYMKKNE